VLTTEARLEPRLQIVKKNWAGLTRFMANEIHRAETQGIQKMFSNFGDWVPPPSGAGHVVVSRSGQLLSRRGCS
jgi:hypothetical protein